MLGNVNTFGLNLYFECGASLQRVGEATQLRNKVSNGVSFRDVAIKFCLHGCQSNDEIENKNERFSCLVEPPVFNVIPQERETFLH